MNTANQRFMATQLMDVKEGSTAIRTRNNYFAL
jgi:hypothetical protein